MATKDIYHDIVKEALITDGWKITSDPYRIITSEKIRYEMDLGADRIIEATKENEKIVVEIKSFLSQSVVYAFHGALGQFLIYLYLLKSFEKNRTLFLAIPDTTYDFLTKKPTLIKMTQHYKVNLLIFNPTTKTIEKWIKQ